MISRPFGIYIHIPFCVRKCPYCDFTSFTPGTLNEDEYVAALIREMDVRSGEYDLPVETVYFGGGTPSLLSPKAIEAILNAVSKNFRVPASHPASIDAVHPEPVEGVIGPQDRPLPQGGREITLEANPGTVTFEKLKEYIDAGVNRLSIGVQSLNDRLLSSLGRIHTRAEAINAYESARKAGFKNIGIDLIHSVPGESMEDWMKDLHEAAILRPEHISAYNLTVEEETHFGHLQEKGLLTMPHEEAQAEMFLATREILTKAGYEHYEISNYALPGFRSRHNQIYWKGGAYLGLGVSAHSFIPPPCQGGNRKGNSQDLSEYLRLINEKGTAFVEEEVLTKEQAMGEAVFLGLRMMEGVDLRDFEERFSLDIRAAYPEEIDDLARDGFLKLDGGRLRLTDRGLLFLNDVSLRFV